MVVRDSFHFAVLEWSFKLERPPVSLDYALRWILWIVDMLG